MANNYSSWPVDKLEKEIIKIKGIIKTRKSRDKKEALAKVMAVARKSGFELHELVEGGKSAKAGSAKKVVRKKAKARGKVAPKYKNPENSKETWTGRGRTPLWVRGILDKGGSLDNILIK